MTTLAEAQQQVADHLKANGLDCDPINPFPPVNPQGRAAYVWPANDWVTPGEAFCGVSVGLVVDVVIGTGNLIAAQEWLAARVHEIWSAGAVEFADGETTEPERTVRTVVIGRGDGELLAVRTEYTRFVVEV